MKISRLFLFPSFLLIYCFPALAADVTGHVKLTGTPPAPEKFNMSSDPACADHGGLSESEEVVASSDGSLANTFVYVLEGVKGNFDPPAEPVQLDQSGCRYRPHVLGVQLGQVVEIINSDATLHNVRGMSSPANRQFNLGMPVQGMKIQKKFDKSEVMFKLKCDVHPWMSAYIGILPHPFFTVTGPDGNYTIKNLPPGEYKIAAWHEKYGISVHKIKIADGDTAPIQADFNYAG